MPRPLGHPLSCGCKQCQEWDRISSENESELAEEKRADQELTNKLVAGFDDVDSDSEVSMDEE